MHAHKAPGLGLHPSDRDLIGIGCKQTAHHAIKNLKAGRISEKEA